MKNFFKRKKTTENEALKLAEEARKAFETEQTQIRNGWHKVVDGVAVAMTEAEIAEFNTPQPIEEIIDAKTKMIKIAVGKYILSNFSDIKQRNVLMSGDNDAIVAMNDFIAGARKKSNDLESSLESMTREELQNLVIEF